jgi:hypothetical protein
MNHTPILCEIFQSAPINHYPYQSMKPFTFFMQTFVSGEKLGVFQDLFACFFDDFSPFLPVCIPVQSWTGQ